MGSPAFFQSGNCIALSEPYFYRPRKPMPEAVKYLGVYLDSKSNNHRNASTRISRAMGASKKLAPLMKHGLLPPNWKLLVYRSVVQFILMYAMDSLLFTPAQLTMMDSVHYKCLRRIFKIKSSYLHRVINPPSSFSCSNHQYLAELAFSSRRVISPSQHTRGANSLIDHDFYAISRAADIRQAHPLTPWYGWTILLLYRQVPGVARNKASWVPVVNKPSRKPPQRS